MPILSTVAVPHPPIILPEVGKGREAEIRKTADAYKAAMAFLASYEPDTVVLLTPHSVLYSDYFHISPGGSAKGDFAQFGAPGLHIEARYDEDLTAAIEAEAAAMDIPAGTRGQRDATLDHGTMIPLYFLDKELSHYKLVRIGLSGLPPSEHYRLGQAIKAAAGDRRVAVIASADLSHKLREDGPYGFVPEGPALDEKITGALADGDFGRLLRIDPQLAERGAECGLRSLLIMAGALDGQSVEAELLSYEGTFGVGYAVASFAPGGPDESRHFADALEAGEEARVREQMESGDAYVKLARRSLEHFVNTGEHLPEPADLSGELTGQRAGVFVSLHREGALRGCIGTISPATASVAKEILRNSVLAASEDPRFPPVTPGELATLEVGVDVLGDAELVDSMDELDPQRYGVIVSHAGRRGLLLPALDGVDTAQQQVDIAMRKAGIPAGAPVKLERFEVVRHE